MANREYRMQLRNGADGTAIMTAGGKCYVATAGAPGKATLYDKDGASLSNPVTPTRGFINFFVADTVASVDLYVMAPGGQFAIMTSVTPSGMNEININSTKKEQLAKIPFSIADTAAATETDTGFDVPDPSYLLDRLHGCGIYVSAIHSAKTIDVGLGEVTPAESGGDANGLIAASSVGTAGLVIGTNGALFSSNAPHKSDVVTAKSITYTLSSGTTTATGFILLPYRLI